MVVTNGAMHALGICFRSLFRAGDEVVVPSPCFFFEGPIRSAGAVPVYVPGARRRMALGCRGDRARDRAPGGGAPALQSGQPDRGSPHAGGGRRRHVARGRPRAARRLGRGLRGRSLGRRRVQLGLRARRERRSRSAVWARASPSRRSAQESLSGPPTVSRPAPGRSSGTACASISRRRSRRWPYSRGQRDWLDAVHAGLGCGRAVALAAVEATPGLAAGVPAAAPFLFVHADSGEPRRRRPRGRRPPGGRRDPLSGPGLREAAVRGRGAPAERSRARSRAGPRWPSP